MWLGLLDMINYDHALAQLHAAGLMLDRDSHGKGPMFEGRVQRWRVEGEDNEWRGWTRLNQWTSPRGNTYAVGVFGCWRGADPGTQKIELPPPDPALTQEQLAARREEDRAVAEAARVASKQMEAVRKAEALTAARWSAAVWAHAKPCTSHDYLARKGVNAHGVRLLDTLDGLHLEGVDDANWWRLKQSCAPEYPALVIPMHDVQGQVCGVQFVYGAGHPRKAKTGRDKEFWPTGMAMGGTFGVIGPMPRQGIAALGEGFATMASVHESTGLTAIYAFSANNLIKASREIRKAFPRIKLLITADDDYLTDGNPGCTAAAKLCAQVPDTDWIKPDFTDADGQDRRDGKKLTDFNDLAQLVAPIAVATQINARLDALSWRDAPSASAAAPKLGGGVDAVEDMPARLSLSLIHI